MFHMYTYMVYGIYRDCQNNLQSKLTQNCCSINTFGRALTVQQLILVGEGKHSRARAAMEYSHSCVKGPVLRSA